MNADRKYIYIIGVIFLAILVGYLVFRTSEKNKNQGIYTATTTERTSSTTIVDLAGGVKAVGTGDFKVEKLPPVTSGTYPKPIPNLKRSVVFGENVNEETKAFVLSKVEEIVDMLEKNPESFPLWIEIGMYHKMAEDFVGASIYWEYASKIFPDNFVSFGNLGNLYAYYIKDISKAEIYYNLAISKAPSQVYLYFQLAEVYRDILKDNSKALDTVERGLKVMPGNIELEAFKNTLK